MLHHAMLLALFPIGLWAQDTTAAKAALIAAGRAAASGAAALATAVARAMVDADRAFARFSADSGGPAGAFARWVASDGMLLGGRAVPARGPEQVGKAFAGFPADGNFAWGPIDDLAVASRDGDLGFTIGEARIAATASDVSYSKYLTIWRRERDGRYRLIFDIGSDRPAPPGRYRVPPTGQRSADRLISVLR